MTTNTTTAEIATCQWTTINGKLVCQHGQVGKRLGIAKLFKVVNATGVQLVRAADAGEAKRAVHGRSVERAQPHEADGADVLDLRQVIHRTKAEERPPKAETRRPWVEAQRQFTDPAMRVACGISGWERDLAPASRWTRFAQRLRRATATATKKYKIPARRCAADGGKDMTMPGFIRQNRPSRPAVDASTRAAEVFEAALREGCTSQQARDRVNGDRRLVEAVDRQWHGQQLGDDVTDNNLEPVNDARRRVIAQALGLGAGASGEEIGAAFDAFSDEELPRIAAALRLPEASSRETIARALQKFLRASPDEPDDDQPKNEIDQPVVWAKSRPAELARRHPGYAPRPGSQRAPTPNAGHYHGAERSSLRAQLAELARRLATERSVSYAQALSALVLEDPQMYQRCLLEF